MNRLQMISAAVFIVVALPPVSKAQDAIPNPGFEQWTAGNPDGWLTSNADPIFNVTSSSDAHSGSLAARGEVIELSPVLNFPPSLNSASAGELGIPISQRWASVRGFYKFSPMSGDRFYVNVVFTKASTPIASGVFVDFNTVSTYQEFVANMTYLTGDVPDTAFITISIFGPIGPDYHAGSVMLVDDLSLFDVLTSVEERADRRRPLNFGLQNYPNPFNPSTTISYFLPQRSQVRLQIFNILGQPVRTLADEEQAAGGHSVTWNGTDDKGKILSSGIYFYRLQGKDYSEVNKMLLLK